MTSGYPLALLLVAACAAAGAAERSSLAALVPAARQRGVSRLAALQAKPEGYWGGTDGGDPVDRIPTRVAVTALCVEALDEAGLPDGKAAAAAGLKYVLEQSGHRSPEERSAFDMGNDHSAYAWAMSLSLFARRYAAASGEERKAYAEAIERLLGVSAGSPLRYSFDEYLYGGVEQPATFQAAWLVHGLLDAKAQGFHTPQTDKLLLRTLEALERSRRPDGGFGYMVGGPDRGSYESSAARNSIIELALLRAGSSDEARLAKAAKGFLDSQAGLEAVLRSRSRRHHVGPHAWAKYYYLFGAYWTAAGLARLAPSPESSAGAEDLAKALLALQGDDGSWVDSPEAGGPAYGTAMALRTLAVLEPLLR